MATVYTKNPPISHRPNVIPQTTSSTYPSTQQQNTTAPRTVDGKVGQFLAKARLPMGKDEAQTFAEELEKMLDPHYPITLHTRRQCFRGLVKLCGEHGILPASYLIPESKVERLGDGPIYRGWFSEVWPGMYEDEKYVAIKVMRCYETDNAQNIRKSFCREVITSKRLSHPNILELIGVTMDGRECTMVSPWMDYNITEYLREDLQANPLKLLEDAARGLQYLHSVELAHGDLKGANIMVSEDGRACLTDVGFMRIAGDLSSGTATTNTSTTDGDCTVRWSAPEILDPERFGFKRGGPTKKSDIYSMGMTIYEILTDRIPFYEWKELTVMHVIGQGVRPQKPIFIITRGYTEELWELTTSCWDEKPTERPNVDEVLEALRIAAEQWEPQNGGSSQSDWSPTLYAESDLHALSEPEDEHVTMGASPPSPVTKTLVHAVIPPPSKPPSLPPPSTTKNETSPEHIPVISDEETTTAPPASKESPQKEPINTVANEEGTRSEPVGSLGEEETESKLPHWGKKMRRLSLSARQKRRKWRGPRPLQKSPPLLRRMKPKRSRRSNPLPVGSLSADPRREKPPSKTTFVSALEEGGDNYAPISRTRDPPTSKEGAKASSNPRRSQEVEPLTVVPFESASKQGPIQFDPHSRQVPVTQMREEMEPVLVGQSSQEGRKQGSPWVPLPPRSTSISPSSKGEAERPAPVRQISAISTEDTRQTLATSGNAEQIQGSVQEVIGMPEKQKSSPPTDRRTRPVDDRVGGSDLAVATLKTEETLRKGQQSGGSVREKNKII